MTAGITLVYDAIRVNVTSIPKGAKAAGYVTGTGIVPWGAAQEALFPGFVRIAQSPALSLDEAALADVLDMESGAATLSDCAPWAREQVAQFAAGKRPGQRRAMIYQSRSNVTPVVNALIAGGVTSGVSLWIAQWGIGEPVAAADVLAAAGPFPVHAWQYEDLGSTDVSTFSDAWLDDVSVAPGLVQHPAPSGMSQTVHGGAVTANFGWGTVNAQPQYHFQLGVKGSASYVVNEVISATHIANLALQPGTAYEWRVSVAGGTGLWSAWQEFVTP